MKRVKEYFEEIMKGSDKESLIRYIAVGVTTIIGFFMAIGEAMTSSLSDKNKK